MAKDECFKNGAQLPITARMCIGASEGASGSAALRRAAPPHGPFGLGATSHTCGTLYAIAPIFLVLHNDEVIIIQFVALGGSLMA
jgi:hypothetical protein